MKKSLTSLISQEKKAVTGNGISTSGTFSTKKLLTLNLVLANAGGAFLLDTSTALQTAAHYCHNPEMTEERGHRKVKPLTHKSRYTVTATINNVTDVSTKMKVCVKKRVSFIGG